jgi:hypothetical protein
MADHFMNYVECDAEALTLVEWRRARTAAAKQDKPRRKRRFPSLKSLIPPVTPAPAF